ncbi:hypothetical protein HPMG_00082 [Helicobacter pullorum MIT 98-5489]|uniref:Uncharacterized protein n=1 Tax=Helicobacter pullorum MIT 98-5489 TaxID=537972 RepID=C5EX81_9HELI|nr:hypothetical protein HPMG_00082 [Helicobacter pullorum MIT 98-5489]OCR09785.1 hypothetical protein A7X13_04115 [Helicobacter pullorum]OCR17465.1 hypothetical protein BA919_01160 [Helicobacter pullorum]
MIYTLKKYIFVLRFLLPCFHLLKYFRIPKDYSKALNFFQDSKKNQSNQTPLINLTLFRIFSLGLT